MGGSIGFSAFSKLFEGLEQFARLNILTVFCLTGIFCLNFARLNTNYTNTAIILRLITNGFASIFRVNTLKNVWSISFLKIKRDYS